MANSLLSLLGGSSSGVPAILMQAVGAALRGESPQAFMKRLANQHPQLKRMNLDDLQGTAQALCRQNGVDPADVTRSIEETIGPMIPK